MLFRRTLGSQLHHCQRFLLCWAMIIYRWLSLIYGDVWNPGSASCCHPWFKYAALVCCLRAHTWGTPTTQCYFRQNAITSSSSYFHLKERALIFPSNTPWAFKRDLSTKIRTSGGGRFPSKCIGSASNIKLAGLLSQHVPSSLSWSHASYLTYNLSSTLSLKWFSHT